MFGSPYSVALRWYIDGRTWRIPFNYPFAVRIRRGTKNWHSFLVENEQDWDLLIDFLIKEESERLDLNLLSQESDSLARIEKGPRKGDEVLVFEKDSQKWIEAGYK